MKGHENYLSQEDEKYWFQFNHTGEGVKKLSPILIVYSNTKNTQNRSNSCKRKNTNK